MSYFLHIPRIFEVACWGFLRCKERTHPDQTDPHSSPTRPQLVRCGLKTQILHPRLFPREWKSWTLDQTWPAGPGVELDSTSFPGQVSRALTKLHVTGLRQAHAATSWNNRIPVFRWWYVGLVSIHLTRQHQLRMLNSFSIGIIGRVPELHVVKPLLTNNSIIQTPLYYRQFS